MDFVQNQYVLVIGALAGFIAMPLSIIQLFREFGGSGAVLRKSKAHLESVTDISREDGIYMSACVLILLVRILASFFLVTFSILMVISSLFLHSAGAASPVLDVLSIALLLFSAILLVATLLSARRFSETVRRKIAPGSLESRQLI